MSNTWTGATFAAIGQRALRVFGQYLAPIKAFVVDLDEGDPKARGASISVPLVPASAGASDLQTSLTGNRASACADTTTTAVTVTLNQQPIDGFYLTDTDAQKLASGIIEDTKQNVIATKVNAVADTVLDYIFALITSGNYTGAFDPVSAAAFDVDDVVDMGATLKGLDPGWPIGKLPTTLVASCGHYAALKKDNAIQNQAASGLTVIQDGILERVDSFGLIEAPTLPTTGNLAGFIARPQALAVAFRSVESQSSDRLMHYEELVDEESGLILVYRAWYDPNYGRVNHTIETLFGASVGDASALYRIVSA